MSELPEDVEIIGGGISAEEVARNVLYGTQDYDSAEVMRNAGFVDGGGCLVAVPVKGWNRKDYLVHWSMRDTIFKDPDEDRPGGWVTSEAIAMDMSGGIYFVESWNNVTLPPTQGVISDTSFLILYRDTLGTSLGGSPSMLYELEEPIWDTLDRFAEWLANNDPRENFQCDHGLEVYFNRAGESGRYGSRDGAHQCRIQLPKGRYWDFNLPVVDGDQGLSDAELYLRLLREVRGAFPVGNEDEE